MSDAKKSFGELSLKGQQKSFKNYLLSAPDMSNLDVSRDTSFMRDVNARQIIQR